MEIIPNGDVVITVPVDFRLTTTAENEYVSLHGGPKGFDSLIWTLLESFSQSSLFTKSELDTIVTEIPGETSKSMWRLVSEDGDQGFPGRLTVEVLIGLKESPQQTEKEAELKLGSIVVIYRARVEGKSGERVVTPINLAQVCISFLLKHS